MSTPGQAAYEAYEAECAPYPGDRGSWEAEDNENREAWEAAAQAAIAASKTASRDR